MQSGVSLTLDNRAAASYDSLRIRPGFVVSAVFERTVEKRRQLFGARGRIDGVEAWRGAALECARRPRVFVSGRA